MRTKIEGDGCNTFCTHFPIKKTFKNKLRQTANEAEHERLRRRE